MTATTSKILYTLFFDNSNLPDQAAKDADSARRRTQFMRGLENMKILAEGGTLPPPLSAQAVLRLHPRPQQRSTPQQRPRRQGANAVAAARVGGARRSGAGVGVCADGATAGCGGARTWAGAATADGTSRDDHRHSWRRLAAASWTKVWQAGGNSADGILADRDGNVLVAQEDFGHGAARRRSRRQDICLRRECERHRLAVDGSPGPALRRASHRAAGIDESRSRRDRQRDHAAHTRSESRREQVGGRHDAERAAERPRGRQPRRRLLHRRLPLLRQPQRHGRRRRRQPPHQRHRLQPRRQDPLRHQRRDDCRVRRGGCRRADESPRLPATRSRWATATVLPSTLAAGCM